LTGGFGSYIPTSLAGSNDNLSFAKSIIVCAVEPAQVTIINQMLGLMVRRRDGGLQPAARAFNVEGAAVDERNKAEGTQQMLEKLKPLRTICQGDNSFAIRRCLLGIFPIDSGKLLSGGLVGTKCSSPFSTVRRQLPHLLSSSRP